MMRISPRSKLKPLRAYNPDLLKVLAKKKTGDDVTLALTTSAVKSVTDTPRTKK